MAQLSLLIYFQILSMIIINTKPSLALIPTYFSYNCSNTTMFTNNSHYQTNLNILFHYLTSNATNRYGYHAATAGVGTNNVVYGHFLCRGDQSKSSCQDCVTTATTDLPDTYCPNRKVAIIWYDECMVRYTNESFFGIFDHDPGYILSDPKNVTGNVSQFTDTTDDMLINIVNHASGGGSEIKYGTGGVVFTSSVTVYGLAQCTPDLNSSDCKMCLVNIIAQFPICKGSRLLRPSCNARFETYQFFNGNVDVMGAVAPSLPPLPPPRSNATRTETGAGPGPGTMIISPTSGNSKTSTNKVIAIVVGLALLQLDYLQ